MRTSKIREREVIVDEAKFYAEIAHLVQKHREERGLSRQQLAVMVGVSRPNIVHVETRYIRVSLFKLVKIAQALEVSLSDLLPMKYKK